VRVSYPPVMPFRSPRNESTEPASNRAPDDLLSHASETERAIVERATPHTMTGAARILAVIDATRYCVERGITGAFVECGVWRGGSVLAMILTLQELRAPERDIYLYDTFEGMTAPTEDDVSDVEGSALEAWQEAEREQRRAWEPMFGSEVFNEDAVRALLLDTGYPADRLKFVRGAVEETLPGVAPEQVALLRLDTDWYESTWHELVHLFPRLVHGGVLIIDDYGHWRGARRAVDEYFGSEHPPLLLNRIDYTGRIAVKQ
jgi:O-methyltransferase